MSDPDTYDTPKPAVHINYDLPRSWNRSSPHQGLRPEDTYDVPRPINLLAQQNVTPSSSNSSLLTPDSLSLSSSNRSSLANMPDYDIPRRYAQPVRNQPSNLHPTPTAQQQQLHHQQQQHQQQQQQMQQSTYDIPSIQTENKVKKELPLELSSALETLARLQNEATGAVTK